MDAIAGRLRRVTVLSGTTIVRQGGPAEKFFIIVDGTVEVIHEDGGSDQIIRARMPNLTWSAE